MKKLFVIFLMMVLMTSCKMWINDVYPEKKTDYGWDYQFVESPLVVRKITKSYADGFANYEIVDKGNHGVVVLIDTIGRFNVGDKLDLIRK